MKSEVPKSWHSRLREYLESPVFDELSQFVEQERANHEIFPSTENVFRALELVAPEQVRAVILGQDPYHGPNQAHGLSFSVQHGIKQPPSLKNIFKEFNSDTGFEIPDHGNLEAWAREGVLLLNTVLTVRCGEANSHRKRGWEQFTDSIIRAVSDLEQPTAFVLWGRPAQKKKSLINERHFVIESAHPSPLSVRHGFYGSKPFSKVNAFLAKHDRKPIDWKLPMS